MHHAMREGYMEKFKGGQEAEQGRNMGMSLCYGFWGKEQMRPCLVAKSCLTVLQPHGL